MMVTNLNNYATDGNDDDDDFGYHYRENMIVQFKQDLNNKISVFKIKVNAMK